MTCFGGGVENARIYSFADALSASGRAWCRPFLEHDAMPGSQQQVSRVKRPEGVVSMTDTNAFDDCACVSRVDSKRVEP